MANRGPKPKDRPIVVPLPGRPQPPPDLDAAALAHWQSLTDMMAEAGYLSALDGDALTLYMSLWTRWVEAEAMVDKEGAVIEGGPENNRYLQANPWYTIATQAQRDMRPFLTMFGLSPAARRKLAVAETDETPSKWQEPA